MKNRNVTISDIAKELGITPSTVSRALSNSTRVNEKTRLKVQLVAQRMGYHPNVMASSLRKGTSGTIGMIVPRINRHFFSNVICGVERIVNPAGFNLLIYQSDEQHDKEVLGLQTFLKNRVAGIIISLASDTDDYSHLQQLSGMGVPLVQFDRVKDDLQGAKIVNDNFNGAYLGVKHLIKSGYKRIAHLAGALHLNVYNERLNGYLAALKEIGMGYDDRMIVTNVITRDAGADAITKVIDAGADAVFCAGDYSALGAMLEIKKRGLIIPDNIGVLGFANEPFAEIMSPALTSVEQNAFEIGNRAAQAIIQMIEKKDATINTEEVVPVRLIVRESTIKNNCLTF
ncbi:MAG: LacI family DNA-binding transcriptional regulator [Marinilabiliaceae bacterium]|nr:LacI family DNA-binding transcriptional regulator [Marinilabiliaceae bacterium]